jgi:hypothetical protein
MYTTLDEAIRDFSAHLAEKGLGPIEGIYRIEVGRRAWALVKEETWRLVEDRERKAKATFSMDEETFLELVTRPGLAAELFVRGRVKVDRLPFALPLLYQLKTLAS